MPRFVLSVRWHKPQQSGYCVLQVHLICFLCKGDMAMYDLRNYCNIIAELRRKMGWSQAVLAEKLGISPQAISKWECGVGLPDVTLFPVIAETLRVPIGVLFGEKAKRRHQLCKKQGVKQSMKKSLSRASS